MRRRATLAFALSAVLAALSGPAFAADAQDTASTPGTSAAGTLALQCGRLFDSRSGKVLGAHTVVVRAGRIAEVRSGLDPVAGAEAVVLSPMEWSQNGITVGAVNGTAEFGPIGSNTR